MKGGIPILQNLEKLEVTSCEKIQHLFETAELWSTQQALNHHHHHHLSLKSLKVVEIGSCNKMRYVFPVAVANSLGQLETLRISNCLRLAEIIQETEASNTSLRSPREVHVSECNNLTSLSSLSHCQFLENLTDLYIQSCCRLEYTFPNSMAEGTLPQLKTISLRNLPQLKGNDIVFTLPSLQQLEVMYCPLLTPFIIWAKIQGLMFWGMGETKQLGDMRGRSPNIEYLTITNFEDHLFDGGSYNLSCLKNLTLWDLPKLRVIWNLSPIQVVNFQNLTEFNVDNCGRLRYIFTATIARNLPQLRSLTIRKCDGLEQIIEKDETSSQDDHQPIYFPNLVDIRIRNCANLESLFPVSVAHHLPKLKILSVINVHKLEKVFGKGDEANVSNDKEKVIHLPHLETVKLEELPDIKSFSPMAYHFVLPSLHSLAVISCPNIITRFSVESKQYGHAITETIPSIDEHIADEFATSQETTWRIGTDIEYERKF
ncbi:hypothetical protein DITRI_Ditri01bG0138800 [Diplodiscus trichospermus]